MKAVVTGGTGFLGGHLVTRLVAEGYDVTYTGRTPRGAPPGSRFERVDLLDDAGLKRVTENAALVFHCAALSSPWGRDREFEDANVTGTRHVVAACLHHRVERLIHVSTPSIYTDGRNRLMVRESEALPARAINTYARSKRLAETIVEQASTQLGVISIRPRAIFGPGDTTIFPRFIEALRSGRLPIIGSGANVADLSHVSNVVDALLLCARADDAHLGKVFNITNGEPVRLWQVIREVAERLGLPVPSRRVPYRVAYAAAAALEAAHRALRPAREPRLTRYGVTVLARSMTLDIGAARRDLGYAPRVTMRQGLDEVVQGYRRADGSPHG